MRTAASTLPLAPSAPRAPHPAALRLRRAGRAIWLALEADARARAGRQLRAYADACERHDPDLARTLREASVWPGR